MCLKDKGIGVLEVGEENQLFLDDDYLISKTRGIDFVLGKPTKFKGNPVLRLDMPWEKGYAYASVMLDEEEDLFKMWTWLQGDDGHPKTGYAVSRDGINWEKPILGIEEHEGSKENNISFCSHNPAERRAQTNHVLKDYLDPDPDLSRDGVKWRRYREAFIQCGEKGTWDGGMIFPSPAILVKGDAMFIYYRGEDRLHGEARDDHQSGVGCAQLRKDGFIGLHAGDQEGVVETRPLAFSRGGGEIPTRGRLYLNVKADCGRVRVKLCDLDGTPIPGFSGKDCDTISEDSISKKVTWNGNPVLDKLHGSPMVMRIFLQNATLYSMKFQRTGEVSDPIEERLSQLEAKWRTAPIGKERQRVKEEMIEYIDGMARKG